MSSYEQDAAFVRQAIVHMACAPAGAHLGGALSCCDMILVLYREIMRYRPTQPDWPERDFFILSKGHAAPALYATLALAEFIDPAELETFARPGSRLAGHPKRSLPGVEFATGSLGHGLSLAVGLALKLRAEGRPNRVYVILGDGELQEGSVWEAAHTAGKYRLSNLTALVDVNHLQINGPTDDWLAAEALPQRWQSYGWQPRQVDGHDHQALAAALGHEAPVPRVILAETVKAKGIDFMERHKKSHHVTLTEALRHRALASLTRIAAKEPSHDRAVDRDPEKRPGTTGAAGRK